MIRRLLAALATRRTARLAALDVAMVPRPAVVPDDPTALADVLREQVICGNRHYRNPALTYVCDLLAGHEQPHADHSIGTVSWYTHLTPADHGLAWSPPEPVQIDPPTTRPYAVPDTACRAPDVVIVGTAKVHRQCRDLRRDGRPGEMCNHCAPLLARSATEVQW